MSMSVNTVESVERVKALEQEVKELTNEIKRLKKCKKYGLVWEEHEEELDKKNVIPLLVKDESLSLPEIADKPMNYLIEGDNYHALKALQHTHRGRIDVIYIDPPYNTGNRDFVYNDKYVDSEDNFRHSKWLSFMNKRLKLARELMSDDGVIFISIDDNEMAQLKILCDEIFGEDNFVSNVTVETGSVNGPKMSHVTKTLIKVKEYLLVYCKNKKENTFNPLREVVYEHDTKYNFLIKNGERVSLRDYFGKNMGDVTSVELKGLYADVRAGNLELYRVMSDFKESMSKFNEYQSEFKVVKELDGFVIYEYNNHKYLYHKNTNKIEKMLDIKPKINESNELTQYRGDLWKDFFKHYKNVGKEGGVDFKNGKKSLVFIKDILHFANNDNAIVLDFFAGSGTTGHAVMELNKEDGGNRSFILCTNNEVSDERIRTYLFEQGIISKNNKTEFDKYKKNNPEDYQNFLKSPEYESLGIARAVTRERLKRVIEGYTTPKGKKVEALPNNLTYLKTRLPCDSVLNVEV